MNTGNSSAPQLPQIWAHFLWGVLLIALFPGQILLGSYGSGATVVASILAISLLWGSTNWHQVFQQRTLVVLACSFLLLVIPFFFTAEDPSDLKYVLNFIAFPLAIPAFFLARRYAGPHWAIGIAILSLSATLIALLFAATEVNIIGMKRAGGFMSNANMLAHLAVLFGFISLVGYFFTNKWWRILFLSGPIIAVVVTLLAGSRGGLLSALPLMFIGFLFLARNKGGRRWVFAGLAAAILLVAGYFVLSKDATNPVNRVMRTGATIAEVLNGHTDDWGTMMRIELYKGAVRAFNEAPIIGHGWQDAVVVAASQIEGNRKATGRRNSVIAARWPNMHNDALGFAAASGIFGILAYLGLIVAPFLSLKRSNPYFATQLYIASCLVTITVTHGLINAPFGHDLGVDTYAMMTAIVLGVFWTPSTNDEPQT